MFIRWLIISKGETMDIELDNYLIIAKRREEIVFIFIIHMNTMCFFQVFSNLSILAQLSVQGAKVGFVSHFTDVIGILQVSKLCH